MENSTKIALLEVQEAFNGEARKLGIETEEDVIQLVKLLRQE